MKFSHYSKPGFELHPQKLRDDAKQPESGYGMKPEGLWLSVDGPNDWLNWCRGESFGDYTQVQQVTLRSNALLTLSMAGQMPGILCLEDEEQLDEFTRYYCARIRLSNLDDYISWERVARDYDGIIIAPYQWSRRMSLIWYYPWDCACACLWKPSKWISSVSRPKPITFHKPAVTQEGNS